MTPGAPVVLVPRAVLRQDARGTYLWTIVDGRVRRAPVTVGTELGDRIQIARGLSGDEPLVTGDATRLGEGVPVHVAPDGARP